MNIFYSEVDKNLQTELEARGRAFRVRDTNSLNFMLSKIANVEVTAYEATSSKSNIIATLGGSTSRIGRYLPTGPDGYLSPNLKYTQSEIVFNDVTGEAYVEGSEHNDRSRRTGPVISAVNVSIGDHSMGLLNKATITAIIPNPQRDLDAFEEAWLRPGRYARIEIAHPTTAIVSQTQTAGLLTPLVIPNKEKLKKLYPDWDIDELIAEIREMRTFVFEGLITSFEFSYTKDATVEATLNFTGTSNVYTNLSMLTNPEANQSAPTTTPPGSTIPTGSNEFYGELYTRFEELITDFKNADPGAKNLTKFLIPYRDKRRPDSTATDHFILKGEPFPSSIYLANSVRSNASSLTNDSRYITLGALIKFINSYVLSKLPGSEIICTDIECFSVYYPWLVSTMPKEILLLPKEPSTSYGLLAVNPSQECNVYGSLTYYGDVIQELINNSVNSRVLALKGLYKEWPGVYEKNADGSGKLYPSRIFINMETIQKIINDLSDKNTKPFRVETFITLVCSKINAATGNAINLTLVTYPSDGTKLFLTDSKYTRTPADTKKVVAFSVPMFANHVNGTIVQDFQFQASLPDSVKSLSYVLNSEKDISAEDIAPYINYMYTAKNADGINKVIAKYKSQHVTAVNDLYNAKIKYGDSPDVPSIQAELSKALYKYIQFPTEDIKTSNLLTAPIFPFSVSFTIDGISGFRYGDVLTFDGLPTKYKVNTVFSIISISHTVSSGGEWKTQITCIQRPSIE